MSTTTHRRHHHGDTGEFEVADRTHAGMLAAEDPNVMVTDRPGLSEVPHHLEAPSAHELAQQLASPSKGRYILWAIAALAIAAIAIALIAFGPSDGATDPVGPGAPVQSVPTDAGTGADF